MTAFTRFLIQRAGWVALGGLLLTAAGGYYSLHLFSNLRTGLEELLPEQAQSVLDLNEVRARLETTENLSLLILSDNTQASRRFVDDLAEKVKKDVPTDVVANVEYRIDKEIEFFNSRKSLFIQQGDLQSIRNYVGKRLDYEIQLRNPLTIFDNRELKEPTLDFESLKKKYLGKVDGYAKFKNGYYASEDQTKRVMLFAMPGSANGIEGSKAMRAALDSVIAELNPLQYSPDMRWYWSGGVQDLIEEHEALIEDLALSTVIVCVLVGFCMLLYFRTVVGTLCLITALLAGTLWSFGVGFFQVGYLNANSAFMGSIVIGNGVNFGIILLARFLEERRKRKGVPRSVALAVEKTFSATTVAAGAAALAYGSLILTSFRGFRQFGVIGLTGMVLCWIAAYTLIPSLLVIFHRWGALKKPVPERTPVIANFVTRLVQKWPRAILVGSVGLTLVSFSLLSRLDASIIETDMKKLRNIHSAESGSMFWGAVVDDIFGRYLSPIVALPKDHKDVEPIAEAIRKAKAEQGENSFIVSVSTIHDFLPPNQDQKIRILREIDQLLPPRLLNRLGSDERALAQDLLSPNSFQRFDESELPELVRGKFREKDGTVGKLVLIEPSLSPELSKIHNMQNLVHSIREATYSVRPGTAIAGTLMITTDMFESIVHDGPKATLFAFIAVLLLVIVIFRHIPTIAQCIFALLLGVLWLFGWMLLTGFKINFLNFIALPITFGIGVDYAVNVFERYRRERGRNILRVIRETGGAVMLASLTTIIGYGSLLIASNQAFVSFGTLAVLGEITCLIAATLSLPSLLWYLDQRREKKNERNRPQPLVPEAPKPQSPGREETLA